jgi:hypothetical protein
MGDRKSTGVLLLKLLAALVMLGVRFVLWFCKLELTLVGPCMIVTLIILPFLNNPFAHENGLEIAAYFTVICGLILAWLWIIILPLVDDLLLPYQRTVGSVLAGWVRGGVRRMVSSR